MIGDKCYNTYSSHRNTILRKGGEIMHVRVVSEINNMYRCMCEGMCMPIMCCVNFIKMRPYSYFMSIPSLDILPECI